LAAKRLLAWVPDDPQPFDALTVFEHLEFTAELYRIAGFRPKAQALLERFELWQKRDALGGELSRGMRQKLAFCCAFLSSPRLLLLDEPLSGLDPHGIRAARQAIAEQAALGVAVILSSHQLELVEALATRLLILDRGRARFDGPLEQGLAQVAGGNLEDLYFALTQDGRRGGESGGGTLESERGAAASSAEWGPGAGALGAGGPTSGVGPSTPVTPSALAGAADLQPGVAAQKAPPGAAPIPATPARSPGTATHSDAPRPSAPAADSSAASPGSGSPTGH
jgi:ABC-2 type transport system ATP-binding protein